MLVQQHLGGQCWPEVRVLGFDKLDCILPNAFVPAPVSTSGPRALWISPDPPSNSYLASNR